MPTENKYFTGISERDVHMAVIRTESPDTIKAISTVIRNPENLALKDILKTLSADLDRYYTKRDLAALLDVGRTWLDKFLPAVAKRADFDRQQKPTMKYSLLGLLNNEEVLRFLRLPRVDKITGLYINPENSHKYATAATLAEKHKTEHEIFYIKFLQQVSCIRGRDRGGRETDLYDVDAVENDPELKKWDALPRVDESGRLVTQEGTFITLGTKAKELGVASETLRPFIEQQPSLTAKDRAGRPADLYNETTLEANREYQEWKALPKVEEKSRSYQDQEGLHWSTEKALADRYGLGEKKLKEYLSKVRSMPGRGGDGHQTTLYCREDLDQLEIFQAFLNLPVLPGERPNDPGGHTYLMKSEIRKKYDLHWEIIVRYTEGISFLIGKDKTGRSRRFYDETEMLDRGLREYLTRRGKDLHDII